MKGIFAGVVLCIMVSISFALERTKETQIGYSPIKFPPPRKDGETLREWHFRNILDHNGDGMISETELFDLACSATGIDEKQCRQSSFSKISHVMNRLDADNSGAIELHELLSKVNEPIEGGVQQTHLAITTDPTEMLVMWITRDKLDSVVEYGTSANQLSLSKKGTITTYDAGVFGWSGWIHSVLLTGLSTSTKYYYRCGDPADSWSDLKTFTTPPSLKDPQSDQPRVYAVVADMGTDIPMGWAVTHQLENDNKLLNFSLILHAGDVAYAGTGSEWEFEEVWDIWGNQMEPIASLVPYMFAVGNHEKYYNYTSFRTRYTMPGAQSGGNGNFWYSVDYSNVHFTFMSTEHDYSPNSPQYNWLVNDLEAANKNRKQRPWLFVLGHRPMYCSDTVEWDQHKPGAKLQRLIEPLFEKYSVDLYFSGHMHMYERVHPVVNGTVTATGNVYRNPGACAHVVQGTAGVFTDSDFVTPQPSWSAKRGDQWGYGRMTIFNDTTLHFQFMHQWDGKTLDEFWLIKDL